MSISPEADGQSPARGGSSLALAFATIERPPVVQRLIRSVRRYFPDMPIYVADQSREIGRMLAFYDAHRVHLVTMPFDAGVAASRNWLVAAMTEDFFVLCDDDFILDSQTSFGDALAIFAARPEIGVIGGRLRDTSNGTPYDRHWEMHLHYDRAGRLLTSIPIYRFAPRQRRLGDIAYYECDTVLNFAVFRRAIFADGIGWDERFTCNGEHEDFYLNLKLNSAHRVGYLPSMVALHDHPAVFARYRARLRERSEGWRLMMEKWQVDQYLEIGFGVRTIDNPGEVLATDAARRRFPLAPNPARSPAERDGSPAPVFADALRAVPVFFRYDPAIDPDRDFLLWYRAERRASLPVERATAWLRWYGAAGRVLVWEGARREIDLTPDFWQPMLAEVPLLPPGAAWLRFEVVADAVPEPVPLATGFVFVAEAGQQLPAREAMGLTRMDDGAPPADAAVAASAAAALPAMSLSASNGLPICLLQLPDPSQLRALIMTDAALFGDHPYIARMPANDSEAAAIVLPHTGGDATAVRAIDKAGVALDLLAHTGANARSRAARPRPGITVVATSCGRQDLLERTLDSFFAFNTAAVARIVVVEDGDAGRNAALIQKFRGRGIEWIGTGRRVGQIDAIDTAYTLIDTDLIFHLEDDWEFYAPGFIEKSAAVLAADSACLEVMLRALDDTNGHPLLPAVEMVGGVETRVYAFGYDKVWHGFSFNPGLRRTADYRRAGSYGLHVSFAWHDRGRSEAGLSQLYRDLGMHVRILADRGGGGYVRHIGWDRTVPPPASV